MEGVLLQVIGMLPSAPFFSRPFFPLYCCSPRVDHRLSQELDALQVLKCIHGSWSQLVLVLLLVPAINPQFLCCHFFRTLHYIYQSVLRIIVPGKHAVYLQCASVWISILLHVLVSSYCRD